MKKNILLYALAFTVISCNKNELDPVTGYNSEVKLQNIQLYNLGAVSSVTGSIDFKFLLTSDTSSNITDSLKFTKSFPVSSLISNQQIYFNTPNKTKVASFKIKYIISGGTADSVHIESFTYQKDGTTFISKPKYFNKASDSLFTSQEETHIF